jgi:pseudouridine kinase
MKGKRPQPQPGKSVLVIGAAGFDLVGRLKAPAENGISNPADIQPSFGGVARNIAENLARLGQPVSLITAVGKDFLGDELLRQTAAAGVDISACLQSECCHTGAYLAVVNTNGDFEFGLDDMEAIAQLTPAYLHEHAALFHQAGLVVIDGNLPPASMRAVFKLAHEARLPVCADPASTSLAARLIPHLENIYLLSANGAETSVICQANSPAHTPASAELLARCLINLGVEIAVIPIAKIGVVYASGEISGHTPAIATQVVHPTGAGDALTATLIFGLLNDIPLDEAVRLGVSAASLTLRHPGSVLPDLSLEKLYDELI